MRRSASVRSGSKTVWAGRWLRRSASSSDLARSAASSPSSRRTRVSSSVSSWVGRSRTVGAIRSPPATSWLGTTWSLARKAAFSFGKRACTSFREASRAAAWVRASSRAERRRRTSEDARACAASVIASKSTKGSSTRVRSSTSGAPLPQRAMTWLGRPVPPARAFSRATSTSPGALPAGDSATPHEGGLEEEAGLREGLQHRVLQALGLLGRHRGRGVEEVGEVPAVPREGHHREALGGQDPLHLLEEAGVVGELEAQIHHQDHVEGPIPEVDAPRVHGQELHRGGVEAGAVEAPGIRGGAHHPGRPRVAQLGQRAGVDGADLQDPAIPQPLLHQQIPG
jgi:hypothetical protein